MERSIEARGVYHTLDLSWQELQLLKGLIYNEITRRPSCETLDNIHNSLQRLDKYAI